MNGGSELARMAHDMACGAAHDATAALVKIEAHEAECGRRWGVVVRLLYGSLAVMVTILGTLLYDRLLT